MRALLSLLVGLLAAFLRPRASLAAENLALRHQLAVLGRERPAQLRLNRWDRVLWAFVVRRWNGWRSALVIVRPETVIAWHRNGFGFFW